MVRYMDKKIGMIIAKIVSLGIEKNTLVIYAGDNGSPPKINSIFKGETIKGGKSKTTEYGTHVPLVVYSPGNLSAGTVNGSLIDFTDFLPTFASLANIPKPTNYGILDGVSFSGQVYGDNTIPRDWIFCHYHPFPGSHTARWVQNSVYKLYQSPSAFYNLSKDIKEQHPLDINSLSASERAIRKQFLDVLSNEQKLPVYVSLLFIFTTLLTASFFILAVAKYNSTKTIIVVSILICVWLALQAILPLYNFFAVANTITPRFILLVLPPFSKAVFLPSFLFLIVLLTLFVTHSGRRFIDSLS